MLAVCQRSKTALGARKSVYSLSPRGQPMASVTQALYSPVQSTREPWMSQLTLLYCTDGFCHAQRTIRTPLHLTKFPIPFTRTMHFTLFLPVGLRLAVTVLLAISPLISAAPSDLQPSRRELHSRDINYQHNPLPSGWVEQSCLSDKPSARTLTSVSLVTNIMTNGQECYCGNVTTAGATYTSPGDCKIPCPGNTTQTCGGTTSLSLWANGNIPRQHAPTFAQNVGKWTLAGCYSDWNTDRALTIQILNVFQKFKNSAEFCVSMCENSGYTVAGMEFALECWCGTTIDPEKSTLVDDSNCMLACPGNTREYCGGQGSLVVYSSPPQVPRVRAWGNV